MNQEKANYMNSGHLIIDKDVFHEISGFNDALITGEDWEFCTRAKGKGIQIVNKPDLHVIHEGYPKTLREFIHREKWHGIQDFHNFYSFLKSLPAIAALLYWASGIFGIALSIYYKSAIYIAIAIIANSSLCILSTQNKRKRFPLNIIFYFLLYHVYLFARGLALIDRLLEKRSRGRS